MNFRPSVSFCLCDNGDMDKRLPASETEGFEIERVFMYLVEKKQKALGISKKEFARLAVLVA